MAKDKGGRPSLLTRESIQKLEEAFGMDCTVVEACLYADISTSTYYNWVEADPKLLDRFTALRNKPFLKARTTIINSLDEPDYAFKYMERKKQDEFSTKVVREDTVKQDLSIKIDNLTDEELAELDRLTQLATDTKGEE